MGSATIRAVDGISLQISAGEFVALLGASSLALIDHAFPDPMEREKALEIWAALLGRKHPDYAAGLNNLATLYRTEGSYDKAEPLYRRALDINVKAVGVVIPRR